MAHAMGLTENERMIYKDLGSVKGIPKGLGSTQA